MKPEHIVDYIQSIYHTTDFIPLHAPQFNGNEKAYVSNTIDSTFVSSVGEYVMQFEQDIKAYTNAGGAVAAVNGTAALHAALYLAGVGQGDLVLTQPLSFVATANAIKYLGAEPVFVDIAAEGLGLCPHKTADFLAEFAFIDARGVCCLSATGQAIRAVVPMHTFGHPVDMDGFIDLCERWNLCLIEDAAESLGSRYHGRHTGTLGDMGVLSFNGNKIITTGAGGMLLSRDAELARKAKHITTTAKVPHAYEFYHDELGFNYRMPNLNAALGCAQLEQLDGFIQRKRALASDYAAFFAGSEYQFLQEPDYATSNYWLNAIICEDKAAREHLLLETNAAGVMTRPVWQLLPTLPMYQHCVYGDLSVARYYAERVVNIPSSPVLENT